MAGFSVASATAVPVAEGDVMGPEAVIKRVTFQQQPGGGTTGLPLLTQPIVQALNSSGNLDTTFTGNVTITLQGVGVLTGTVTVAAVGGIATFTDLIITGIGTAQLVCSAVGYASATSNNVVTVL